MGWLCPPSQGSHAATSSEGLLSLSAVKRGCSGVEGALCSGKAKRSSI